LKDEPFLIETQNSGYRPQRAYFKMEKNWDSQDDSMLLTLATALKLDWKKVSKKMKAQSGKAISPNFLKIRFRVISPKYEMKNQKLNFEDDIQI